MRLTRNRLKAVLTAGVELPTAQMLERAAEAFYGEGQYPYARTMYEENTTNRPTYVYDREELFSGKHTTNEELKSLYQYTNLMFVDKHLFPASNNRISNFYQNTSNNSPLKNRQNG